jgi:hypothetical protein
MINIVKELHTQLSGAYIWGPWVFSLCNRDSSSPEYGCFDRSFWHYRTEREFPAATYQYLVLSLACLYLDTNSPWYRQSILKEWATAGCRFWARMQRRDGTFDEWLPYEQSHVATAFSMAMITEAMLLFRDAGDPLELGQDVWMALEKAGRWLSVNHDQVVLNHTAGAVTALGYLYVLTGEGRWLKGSRAALDVLESAQTTEGWFPEYGGADPGYTSVSIDFLAKYWRRTRDKRAQAMLDHALSFFVHFVHPDGTVGGLYGSRNTRYLLPHGLLILRETNSAKQALDLWSLAQQTGLGLTLYALDDRYRGFFLSNYLLTLLDLNTLSAEETNLSKPYPDTRDVYFPLAGLFKAKRGDYSLLCGLKKLCVFELFYKQQFLYSDGGCEVVFTDGSRATTQWPGPTAHTSWNAQEGRAEASGKLVHVKSPDFFHYALLPHRLFSHMLGCLGSGGAAVNRRIKELFVKPRKTAPGKFHRLMLFTKNGLEIRDELSWDKPASKVIINMGWGQMHVPSSNFYIALYDGHECLDVTGKHSVTIITTLGPQGPHRSIS